VSRWGGVDLIDGNLLYYDTMYGWNAGEDPPMTTAPITPHAKTTAIKQPSITIIINDGIWPCHEQGSRIYAGHGNLDSVNIAFGDGHAATVRAVQLFGANLITPINGNYLWTIN
jgi:prepilin-type processing-associated H-X9-DG protein